MKHEDLTPFKTCACGAVYATRADWDKLPDPKTWHNENGLCQQRRCSCLSHITVVLVAAMSCGEMRRAVNVLNGMRESFNDQFTSTELLMLIRLCWMSGWDFTPDEWTKKQVADALVEGHVPEWSSETLEPVIHVKNQL